MEAVTSSPLFGIVLSILAYAVGVWLNRKAKTPLVNPLLVAIILVALVLLAFHIPLEHYQAGGDFIALFLAPATASLALSVYRQREILKKNLFPVLLGCAAGSLTSMLSVYGLCRAFRLDEKLTGLYAAQVCHDAYRDGDFQAAWRNRPGDGSRRDHNWNFGLHAGTLADQSVPGKKSGSRWSGDRNRQPCGRNQQGGGNWRNGGRYERHRHWDFRCIYCAAGHAAALIFYRKSSGWSRL